MPNQDLAYLDDFCDNPFWTVKANVEHEIVVYPFSGFTGKNDKGWKVLYMEVKFPGGEPIPGLEIPFWIRADIMKAIKNQEKPQLELKLIFKRTDVIRDGKTIRKGEIIE